MPFDKLISATSTPPGGGGGHSECGSTVRDTGQRNRQAFVLDGAVEWMADNSKGQRELGLESLGWTTASATSTKSLVISPS